MQQQIADLVLDDDQLAVVPLLFVREMRQLKTMSAMSAPIVEYSGQMTIWLHSPKSATPLFRTLTDRSRQISKYHGAARKKCARKVGLSWQRTERM